MKRIIKTFIICIMLISLIGCGKVEDKLADDEVILEGIKYKLDQDDSEYGIKYKVASNFRKNNPINAINYFSENIDNNPYFVIRLLYYKNKTIEYAINDSTESYDKKYETTMNDLDYTVVHFLNFSGADVNIYYHKHKNDVYAFVFTSGIDLSRLEEIFLKSIEYD